MTTVLLEQCEINLTKPKKAHVLTKIGIRKEMMPEWFTYGIFDQLSILLFFTLPISLFSCLLTFTRCNFEINSYLL